MKNLIKDVKCIAYFLSLLILFQSCVAYQKQSYTPEKASESDDKQIKIKTINGETYNLSWIDVEDGNVVSKRSVKRDFMKKDEIEEIIVNNPYRSITIDDAVNHQGNIYIRTKDAKKRNQKEFELYNHIFIDIKEDGEYLKTYSMIGPDTASVIIPISQIEKIVVEDTTKSNVRTAGLSIGVIFLFLGTLGLIDLANTDYLGSMSLSD